MSVVRKGSIRGKLTLLLVLASGAILLNGLAGFYVSRTMHGEVENLFNNDVKPLTELFQFYTGYSVDSIESVQKFRDGALGSQESLGRLREAREKSNDSWASLKGRNDPATAQLLADLEKHRSAADEALDRAAQLIRAGDREQLTEEIPSLYRAIDPMAIAARKMIEERTADAHHSFDSSSEIFRYSSIALIILALAILIALGLFVLSLGNRINKSIVRVSENVQRIADGDLETSALDESRDELGVLSGYIDSMREQLQKQFQTAAVFRAAVENASTNIMIADNDHIVTYMNGIIRGMFARAEADIKKEMPFFSAGAIIGDTIHRYHKDPQRIRNILDNLRGNHFSTVHIGGRTFNQVFSPILDEKGNRMGIVAEWMDRTEEVAAEDQVLSIIERAQEGELDSRMTLDSDNRFI
ncbi:MAG: methyl-accepting chemotaxis protein, partial [Leptospiraceae bacterium]|nr:methyl-accepting chemotaxis protein [Leptospiraceae bacterium]